MYLTQVVKVKIPDEIEKIRNFANKADEIYDLLESGKCELFLDDKPISVAELMQACEENQIGTVTLKYQEDIGSEE